MHNKPFGGRAPLGPAGGAYSAPRGPLAELRGGVPWEGGIEGNGERGRKEEEWREGRLK